MWGESAGLGIRDDWLIESALVTLGQFSPKLDSPGTFQFRGVTYPNFEWRYSETFHSRVPSPFFAPKFTGTECHPEENARWLPPPHGEEWYYGTWEQFTRRMRKQFLRALTQYRRDVTAKWGFKESQIKHAQWTIARLSGRRWQEIVKRSDLNGYAQPYAEVQKRVNEFALGIGLSTLADTLEAKRKKRSNKRQ